jgi:hypothetical protein
MRFVPIRILAFSIGVLVSIGAAVAGPQEDGQTQEFFESRIRPVLVEHCYKCHSAGSKELKGGLRLDTRSGLLAGGETGPALTPGNPGESLLLSAMRHDGLEMPPDEKLPDAVLADFETWIRDGATDPREGDQPIADRPSIDFAAARTFWSFQSPQRHVLPEVKDLDQVYGPIDAFVQARLETAGFSPNPPADRRTLIRRVTFDLIGLPPTAPEVDAFVNDDRPDAYERLVDRLLADPRYGERSARMWLDLARFAEDQAHIVGDDKSLFYPNAWLYRDWVIKAFNADLPFDRFVALQLAADQIAADDETQLAALGFLGLGPKYYGRKSPEVMAEEWEDRIDVVTRGLLGLSVACARCHDHKFEPIATEDYYALAGVFASTEMFNRPLDANRTLADDGQAKDPAGAMHIVRDDEVRDLNVFIRGNVNAKGPVVPRRFLSVLSQDPKPFESGSGRRELAEAIADKANPLAARVIVNRIWGELFGRPLVDTPSDFGHRGNPPTHPELLDDLAVRFMDRGWSIKQLRREIVLSAAYRRSSGGEAYDKSEELVVVTSSTTHSGAVSSDPQNRLLWRMNRRRLDVEQWRDAILAATGRMTESLGGPSIEIDDPAADRRSIYGSVSRFQLNPMLSLFDFPDPNAHSPNRGQTVTPLQKLFVLNSPFLMRNADAFAERLLGDETSDEARITRAYRLLFGRDATDEELRLARAYLDVPDTQQPARWVQFAQVLLASNELLYLD